MLKCGVLAPARGAGNMVPAKVIEKVCADLPHTSAYKSSADECDDVHTKLQQSHGR